jgi:hypothetical protein
MVRKTNKQTNLKIILAVLFILVGSEDGVHDS